MKKYVGMNHFPPPPGMDLVQGWYMDGDRCVYGPVPVGAIMVTDHRNGLTTPRAKPELRLIDPWRNRG